MQAKTIINRYPLYLKIRRNSHYLRMDIFIDREVVYETKCDLCGGPLKYEGYGKDMGWGILYRYAFGICEECHYALSF